MMAQDCANCGKPLSPYWRDKCAHCRAPMAVARPSQLEAETAGWTRPVVVRIYRNDDPGRAMMLAESALLAEHGYEPTTQSEDAGHVHAGRLILTGGLSIFAGKAGIRSDGRITLTYRRVATAPSLVERLAQLDEARASGVISDDEYATARASVLATA